jgi:plastocyanin
MTRRTFARAAAPALGLLVAVAAVAPAVAGAAPSKATLKMVGGMVFEPNRLVGDDMRFNKDVITIKSGGTLSLVDKTGAPHSFSLVKKGQVPRTMKQVDGCFGAGPCDEVAAAHDAIDPETGELREPTKPLVDVGKAGFDRPGDSVVIAPKQKGKVKITAKKGTTLYFICAVHPWMQGKIVVK